jgi:2-methylcitrate dehydratase PrpD
VSLIEELSSFVSDIDLDDVDPSVVERAKYLILDSIGCALAAHSIDKGKMAAAAGRGVGGRGESSIIGGNDTVGCLGAVLANGELIGALDYDALLLPGGHVPGYVIPTPLALAECRKSSGRDFLLSVIIGFELAARISGALRFSYYLPDGTFKWADRQGYAPCNFGAAAAGGKILGLTPGQMANALGVAGHLAQVPTHTRFSNSANRYMTKYGAPGWQSTGAVTAAIWAEMGFVGDTTLLDDPEQGFWKFVGFDGWQPEGVLEGIGEKWLLSKVTFKPYPCCRMLHGALDCLVALRDENQLQPDEITKIVAYCHPTVEEPVFRHTALETTVDATFDFAYLASVVAHRVPIGVEWQDADTMRTPAIRAFREKVTLLSNAGLARTGQTTWERSQHSYVEVHARGSVFRADRPYARGGQVDGALFGLTYADLEQKFRHNAERILTRDQCEKALGLLLRIEEVSEISEVTQQLSPGTWH